MTWTADRCYREGLDFFSAQVDAIGSGDWALPSPCQGWTALDVLGHVGTGTMFGTALLRGDAPAWNPPDGSPGQVVDGDPAQWWHAMVGPAKAAIEGVDLTEIVDSPMGKRSIGDGLSFPAIDLFVHGWDLARAAGHDAEIPAEAIEFAHGALDRIPADMLRSPRTFGNEVPVSENASASDKFLAWTGRTPSRPA